MRSKYHAKPTYVDGIRFASKKEAERYKELKFLSDTYQIQDLALQVKFPLIKKSKYGREVRYIADFVYYEHGKMVVEDVKGYKTDIYKLKKRLMAELFDVEIRET